MTDEELQFLAEEQMERLKLQIKEILDKYYAKSYILDSRVKKLDKLRLKQSLFSHKYGFPIELNDLPDIIGFRISVENEKEVEEISELIKKLLFPSRIVDYFNKPKETGFKAYLYYFENIGINTEIQIMTTRMMEWINITHDEHNNRKYGRLL